MYMEPEDLKTWRAQNNYSQSELARILKVIPLTVSRWERGVREIPSFLHLALECVGKKKGGETRSEGQQKRKRKGDSHGNDL